MAALSSTEDLLLIGTVLASLIGTTGASMVIIRPLLRANDNRRYNVHVVVFFIFLVSNIGGSLTPLGDPPLFLGFLRGVDFFWTTTHLFTETLFVVGMVLGILLLLDAALYHREREFFKPLPDPTPNSGLRVVGLVNFALIGLVMAAILMSAAWKNARHQLCGRWRGRRAAERDPRHYFHRGRLRLARADGAGRPRGQRLLVGPHQGSCKAFRRYIPVHGAGARYAASRPERCVRTFGCARHEPQDGSTNNAAYFWLSGGLSSFLDNAPTYLVFFELAGGEPQALMSSGALTLAAISCGAVFMGANSYIGNAPNFMVYAIAKDEGVRDAELLRVHAVVRRRFDTGVRSHDVSILQIKMRVTQ